MDKLVNQGHEVIQLCSAEGKFKTLEELIREHVEGVFQRYHGNVTRTCKTLGIGRTTLYRKLRAYGLR
jgi:transcriptional regulator of acetoin/glycerol metabolism